jgi:aryl-alcohol dehydrogenase-like predicted oxidoreductase
MSFEKRKLGQTGLHVSPLGIGASYGIGAKPIEAAFHEHGVNLFYWGSIRKAGMKKAIRNLKSERDDMVIVLQSYDRSGVLMPLFHRKGLKALGIEVADLLLLGWHNGDPPNRILDQALQLQADGLVKHLAISGHHRPFFGELVQRLDSPIDVVMTRYNAAHPGAERDIFPFLPEKRMGLMAYTATCWGRLLNPKKMPDGEKPLSGADCYRFALSSPHIDTCMTGPKNEEELAEALKALQGGALSPEEMERTRRIGAFVHG